MDRRKAGRQGEDLAAGFLKRHGYRILGRNFFTRLGEIDIIARDKKGLVFVEVKMRNSKNYGYPSEAVTVTKSQHIQKAALYYLMKKKLGDIPYRFEVASILKREDASYSISLIPVEF
jgi:putative endonuclease